jgi:hypothetical protein
MALIALVVGPAIAIAFRTHRRHGRARPGHPRRGAAKTGPALAWSAARACKCKGFWAVATNLPALDAPNRVGGRVKPGHDAKPFGDLSDAPELIVTNSKRYKRQSYGSYRVSCWFERSRLDRFRGGPGGGVLGTLTRQGLPGICLPLVWRLAAGPGRSGGRRTKMD